jgi:RimJ/RimL family protein N-acetyltransferase
MIFGEGIRLRAVEHDDLPMFVSWFNDPEVRQGLMAYLPMSLAQEEKWFEEMLKRPTDSQPLVFEVQELDEWISIGNIGLFEFNNRVRSAELGIVIGNKSYWNKGYGTKAIQLMLKHCFETLNLNRVSLRVYENNPRAVRCYEKAGFVHEGRLRQAVFQDGEYLDMLMMSVLLDEWKMKKE